MGIATTVAINEGVALLQKLAPSLLNQLRDRYPLLSHELQVGIDAGPQDEKAADQSAALLNERAMVMIAALDEARQRAEDELVSVSSRVVIARRWRLVSQILVVIGSSSSLATLALNKNTAAVIAAVLTLLAALGNLFGEYVEKLLNPQAGTIYDLFQKLSEGVYKAKTVSTELRLALKYPGDGLELKALVVNANVLCEQINNGLIQLLSKKSTR